jgi:hypothetical protein
MKLSTLKRQAQSSTRFRGHRMSWLTGTDEAVGRCRRCDAACWVKTKHEPNSTGISGMAVAMNCTVQS